MLPLTLHRDLRVISHSEYGYDWSMADASPPGSHQNPRECPEIGIEYILFPCRKGTYEADYHIVLTDYKLIKE